MNKLKEIFVTVILTVTSFTAMFFSWIALFSLLSNEWLYGNLNAHAPAIFFSIICTVAIICYYYSSED
jgi:ABC-type thiamin/hydroxymethylpyrimidine transport system permease subunit